MAIKHFKQYLNTVTAQYNEMQANLRQFEEECQEGLVEPERVSAVVQMIAPIKANWEQLMYIDYLLNQPNRKRKEPRYVREKKKLLEHIAEENTAEERIKQNDKINKEIENLAIEINILHKKLLNLGVKTLI